MSIELFIEYLHVESQCVVMYQKCLKKEPPPIFDNDPYLEVWNDISFRIAHNKKCLLGYIIEVGLFDETLLAFQKGLTHKLTGIYDVPQWNIEGYSVGEIIIEAWTRANRKDLLDGIPNHPHSLARKLREMLLIVDSERMYKRVLEILGSDFWQKKLPDDKKNQS